MSLSHPAYGLLRPVTSYASVLLAHNPAPMTLDGTNTWVLRAPGSPDCVVVDPGPDDEMHLQRVAECGPVAHVLLTHAHPDHAAGAARFAALVGAPVQAVDPDHQLGCDRLSAGGGLADGEVVSAAGLQIRVLATPGHTSDSVCFLVGSNSAKGDGSGPSGSVSGGSSVSSGSSVSGGSSVLTGDTVLGRGSTVIAHPDGKLGDYLASLHRLAGLPGGVSALPGHGPELPDAGRAARTCLAHRAERLMQVRQARAALRGQRGREPTPREVVQIVYAEVDPVLWPAAEASVAAQLVYLRRDEPSSWPE